MVSLDAVGEAVLRRRYLRRDERGRVVETPDELFERVARALASVERRFGGGAAAAAARFESAMRSFDFLPNSPTLMNAGTDAPQLAACFVLPIEDSLDAIFRTLRHAALVHQSGGGTGFSFSRLRPQGDAVLETGGVASGPLSFVRVFDAATEQIRQGGRRRGANMAVLDVTHPDVEAFARAKMTEGTLRNFNLSVGTDATFWDALERGGRYDLVNPRTGETVRRPRADDVLDAISTAAWRGGDPGLLFLDRINEDNPTPALGRIEATNPCGEVPLLPYEACVLGSINLATHTDGRTVDWSKLRETAHLAVRMLDDALERSEYPVPEIERAVARTRKIGVGVMGFHDMLVDLRVPYHAPEAVEFAEEVMSFVHEESWEASRRLATERGPFPAWEESTRSEPMRNATTTSVAPTGTISMIAGCSPSVEPPYALAYTKRVLGGLEMVDGRFVELARERGFFGPDLLEALHGRTTVRGVDAVPPDVGRLFHTAHDVPPEQHVRVQAAFQAHVDNAVSKTVNLPRDASVSDVRDVFVAAREHGVKGVTVFRSGARNSQVLGGSPETTCTHGGRR